MATRKRKPSSSSGRSKHAASAVDAIPIVYIHGIASKPPPQQLKREWDLALFGRDMGSRTRMAYWADILHADGDVAETRAARGGGSSIRPDALLEAAGVDADNRDAQVLADALLRAAGVAPASARTRVLPLPAFLRKPIARKFLEALVKDSAAYFFRPEIRKRIQRRLLDVLPAAGEPVIIVAHSQGTVVTLEVLAELAKKASTRITVSELVTIGSPLGVREVQDVLSCPLKVPEGVERWHNFSDPFDPVALDKGIANDFGARQLITDEIVMNTEVRRLAGFNPHSSVGYLSHPKVRRVVHDAARIDIHARFLVARDVAAGLAVAERQPVLIEILEPGYGALGESRDETGRHESGISTDMPSRIARAAQQIARIVEQIATDDVGKAGAGGVVEQARIDPLRRFVAARLTPQELIEIAGQHKELRIYTIWKSSAKRKLVQRSARVIQADAAWTSYGAFGDQIRWAVLDTGIRRDHPHFATHGSIIEVWDCTHPGAPRALADDRDRDGHGTHVAGIVAGQAPASLVAAGADASLPRGIAPKAKLVVYKVLNDRGEGDDAWIIKALDHIAAQNENSSEIQIHGINLSLGGPYDSTVYGCGFSPICAELRRLWRDGVLVVVASGNEGQVEVSTPDGEVELNSSLSIGDPANLEDCIAVGSVNADRPHLYGVSAFSSRGPTADGRLKPDVVAPGERITSCDSRFRNATLQDLYRQESGTSMAAPHVSGLLAAFLSVRREFRGRPDEVKALLLRTCIDLGRDRYHQGHGLPNLMRMLLEA